MSKNHQHLRASQWPVRLYDLAPLLINKYPCFQNCCYVFYLLLINSPERPILNRCEDQTDFSGSWWLNAGTVLGSFSCTFVVGTVSLVSGRLPNSSPMTLEFMSVFSCLMCSTEMKAQLSFNCSPSKTKTQREGFMLRPADLSLCGEGPFPQKPVKREWVGTESKIPSWLLHRHSH